MKKLFLLLLLLAFATFASAQTSLPKIPTRPPRRSRLFQDAGAGAVFLFDAETLVDCSPGARAILATQQAQSGPWVRLMAYLAAEFPGLDAKLRDLAEAGPLTLASGGEHPLLLTAELRGGLTRIAVVDTAAEDQVSGQDPMTLCAQAIIKTLTS